jgi:hypothetical protein
MPNATTYNNLSLLQVIEKNYHDYLKAEKNNLTVEHSFNYHYYSTPVDLGQICERLLKDITMVHGINVSSKNGENAVLDDYIKAFKDSPLPKSKDVSKYFYRVKELRNEAAHTDKNDPTALKPNISDSEVRSAFVNFLHVILWIYKNSILEPESQPNPEFIEKINKMIKTMGGGGNGKATRSKYFTQKNIALATTLFILIVGIFFGIQYYGSGYSGKPMEISINEQEAKSASELSNPKSNQLFIQHNDSLNNLVRNKIMRVLDDLRQRENIAEGLLAASPTFEIDGVEAVFSPDNFSILNLNEIANQFKNFDEKDIELNSVDYHGRVEGFHTFYFTMSPFSPPDDILGNGIIWEGNCWCDSVLRIKKINLKIKSEESASGS